MKAVHYIIAGVIWFAISFYILALCGCSTPPPAPVTTGMTNGVALNKQKLELQTPTPPMLPGMTNIYATEVTHDEATTAVVFGPPAPVTNLAYAYCPPWDDWTNTTLNFIYTSDFHTWMLDQTIAYPPWGCLLNGPPYFGAWICYTNIQGNPNVYIMAYAADPVHQFPAWRGQIYLQPKTPNQIFLPQ